MTKLKWKYLNCPNRLPGNGPPFRTYYEKPSGPLSADVLSAARKVPSGSASFTLATGVRIKRTKAIDQLYGHLFTVAEIWVRIGDEDAVVRAEMRTGQCGNEKTLVIPGRAEIVAKLVLDKGRGVEEWRGHDALLGIRGRWIDDGAVIKGAWEQNGKRVRFTGMR